MGSLGQQLQVMRLNKNQLSGTVPEALMQSRSFSRGVNILRNAAPLADPPRDTCEQDPKLSHRQFQVLSAEPRIYYYPQFLSDAEVAAILEFAGKQHFSQGQINLGFNRNVRRSRVHNIRYIDMPDVMFTVLKRISGEVKVPTNYFDRFQIQIYDAAVEDKKGNTGGAFYGTHHDALERSDYDRLSQHTGRRSELQGR